MRRESCRVALATLAFACFSVEHNNETVMFFFSSGLFNGSAREKPQRDAAEASLHDAGNSSLLKTAAACAPADGTSKAKSQDIKRAAAA